MAATNPTSPDTLISVKVAIGANNRRFKIPLRELGAAVFPDKIRHLLAIPPSQTLVLERFSDSAGTFITLDSANPAIYKQLYRAAKAKSKLRIQATVIESEKAEPAPKPAEAPRSTSNPMSLHSIMTANPSEETLPVATYQWYDPASKPSPAADAPVPRPFSFVSPDQSKAEKADKAKTCTLPQSITCNARQSFIRGSYTVYCNNCEQTIPDTHYHCSICENGDFDLCQACIDSGVLCKGEDHWLIKRHLHNGSVIRSTTTSSAPKKFNASDAGIKSETEKLVESKIVQQVEPAITCNSCVKATPISQLVHCKDCPNFYLCSFCSFRDGPGITGHHPGHTFVPTDKSKTVHEHMDPRYKPGRGVHHMAICDSCDKHICGVRHKCLDCPDWDYCDSCYFSARNNHNAHRFVSLYETIAVPKDNAVRHQGIYCDGPLCKDRKCPTYIRGDRYKCSICHDTDFCANCETTPIGGHNKTHPLIKFKTPCRSVTVSTEEGPGTPFIRMGDFPLRTRSTGTGTASPASANAATQVQTVAEIKPRAASTLPASPQLVQPLLPNRMHLPSQHPSIGHFAQVPVKSELGKLITRPMKQAGDESSPKKTQNISELDAHYISDTVVDGSAFQQGETFIQTWTLQNNGSLAWPVGCRVKLIGGDSMLNVDSNHPSAVSELEKASQTTANTAEVLPGSTYSFMISLRAPQRWGKMISYWRLTAPDGQKIGQKLWCDITVKSSLVSLQDYQLQLILLEQQNKKRLQAARAEIANEMNGEEKPRAASASLRTPEIQQYIDWNLGVPETKRPTSNETAQKSTSSPTPETVPAPVQSEMIFPKLEKESPESSQHDVSETNKPSEHEDELDLVEDVECLGLDDADDTEDGFLTDEEYDILDASDEEYLESQKAQIK